MNTPKTQNIQPINKSTGGTTKKPPSFDGRLFPFCVVRLSISLGFCEFFEKVLKSVPKTT